MSKEIFISSTPHETRLAIVESDVLTEIYYERENEYTLAGSIYNGRVTRVLPGMQSSFVDIGLERDAFLYITDFMEEAPDSAEFDTTHHGDSGGRQPRLPAPERTERGERPTESAPHAEAAPRTENSGRGESNGQRSDRGGRGRRGGRDRNQDRAADKSGDRTAARPIDSTFVPPPPMPDRTHTDAQAADAPGHSADAGEIGEGAPGADGSRRWRGRRGRRRGRGNPAQPGEAGQENSTPSTPPAFAESESSFEIDGQAETAYAPEAPAPVIELPVRANHPEASRGDSAGNRRDERPRDNGRRNEGRKDGRGSRDGRERDSQRREVGRESQPAERSPRGFAPSRDVYAVDSRDASSTGPIENAYPDHSDAPAEPMLLPGESLSKYRKGGDAPVAAPRQDAATIILPSASEFAIAPGWDGGSILPGETLRRRDPESSRPAEARGDQGRGSRQEGRRDGRPDRGGRDARNESRQEPRAEHRDSRHDRGAGFRNAPVAQPATVQVEVVEVSASAENQDIAQRTQFQSSADAGYVAPAEAREVLYESAPLEPVAETFEAVALAEPVAEYEPDEASASYRVDPLPRTEYRQSAPVLELEPEPEVAAAPVAIPGPEPVAEEHSLAHTVTPAPEEPLAPLHSETAAAEVEPYIEAHEITSISAAGEMHSEPLEELPVVDQLASHSASSPIPHEAEVVPAAETVHVVEIAPEESEEFEEEATAAFAPGAGDLAEEVMDDEDEGTAINASSIEEMDDLDAEEHLEGAADLGTMLREMSIDQMTRHAPDSEEEDDELEEDFEEEDQAYELDESESDTEEADEADAELDSERSEEAARTGTPADAEYFARQFSDTEQPARSQGSNASGREGNRHEGRRDGNRDSSRRDGRRGSRERERDRDRGTGERARPAGGSGDRERSGRSGGGRSRQSMQSTNLPAISDLLKPGQEILCQIAKEPMAKKGARITSHIALPGRFLVFMPTVNHTGVSRKIESDSERRRLKEILMSEKGEAAGGFIVRTAASGASEEELRSDLRFLLNLWTDIKARSESSKSPALIYHDLNLIERILRDQVTDNFSAIWVDTENEYERVLRFLQRFQPSLIRRVKLYSKETPLFEQFGITEEINKALRSKVWLKSGGSIVINQTEALVAIDINTGKFVGKTARLEDTIVKTNLDAIPEIVRQIRLRDLGGIIIIDFIDMDERKNRNRVMAALEDELKSDRAPSKVLQFNDFGLVAITRKRVKQSLERTLSTTCNICVGTGMVKSPITVCNDIYVEMKKMHKHLDRGDVMLRVHPEVVKQLKTSGSKWLQEMEEMCGKTILVKSDPSLHPEQFDIH
jgi:ribonuclease E